MKQERILGALYGQALGDAMGMPSELWPRKRVKGALRLDRPLFTRPGRE
jgi:ADP-ribosylglycohydrolase